MPVEPAARLVSGANGEAGQTGFSLASEGVLQSRMLLSLQLQEVADREVFCLQPLQEDCVVLLGSHQVDVVVGREPVPLAAGRDRLDLENDPAPLFRAKRKLSDGRFEESPVVGLDAIVGGGGQIERCRAFEQDEMRRVPGGDFQCFGVGGIGPKAFAVEKVRAQRRRNASTGLRRNGRSPLKR